MGTESASGPGSTTQAPDQPVPPETSDFRRRRAQLTVMAGLFLTFAGLFAYGLQLPIQPANLDRLLPWIAVGFVTMWTGGILSGNALIAPPPGVRPALRGQSEVALLSTVAGCLSAAVVVQRLGPWVSPTPGVLEELPLAAVAAVVVWLGGFLMGNSMRRFVRRPRRARAPSPATARE